jgi:Type IV secretion-system coupling protein DNA-binding domain
MSDTWGRSDVAGTWPRSQKFWFLTLLVVAVACGGAMGIYQHERTWTPLQRWYLSAYLRSAFATGLALKSARYDLLYAVDRKGSRLAGNEDVRPIMADSVTVNFALTDLSRAVGVQRLQWRNVAYNPDLMHRTLRIVVYDDQSLWMLARPALLVTMTVLLAGLGVAARQTSKDTRTRRHGRRLKGPELVSVRRFNRRLRADGVGFLQQSGGLARVFAPPSIVRIPHALESNHLLLMGDSGTGKSLLIRQLLQQLDARGDTAIVYDPAREFVCQFYRPERGDLILNPLDARCPYWSPGDELRHEFEALTLATSLFPDKPSNPESQFFIEGSRRLFGHLLTFRPTAAQLLSWLQDGDELDRLVRGTSYATLIDRHAPPQRTGILASLNMVADTLNLLPAEDACTARWSALQWAERRRGWLFLTSTPETRTRLIPLISLWLDMLVLRLMADRRPDHPRTWFVLDELASLHRLPQLHTAVTENRKSNNPVVLSFQGRSQLETRYGHDAEAMLAQPATKIFLRTNEPRAADWISASLGQIETERLRESRSSGRDSQTSYGLERHVEPLVLASEITGLNARHGYMKIGNLVVRLHVPVIKPVGHHPGYVERPFPPFTKTVAAADDGPDGGGRRGPDDTPPDVSNGGHGHTPFFQ